VDPLRIGIAGLGHVGCGLVDLVQSQDALRLPGHITISGVTANTRNRAEGVAKLAVEAALRAGKPVITANKALIAEHGMSLAKLADENDVDLLFEAAVAGGVPIVRTLRDSLSGIAVQRVSGILNGTCNFLTSEMLASGRDYSEVLAEARTRLIK